jgi:chromate transporter
VLVVMLKLGTIDLVSGLGWLDTRQVLDGVIAGQITPGRCSPPRPSSATRWAASSAAIFATAAIFAPSFVLVAALEPLIGRIRRSPWAGAALDGVTIAALGLMAGVTIDLGGTAITDPPTAVCNGCQRTG